MSAKNRAKEAEAKLQTVLQQIEEQKVALADVNTQNEQGLETLKVKDVEIETLKNETEKMEDDIFDTGALIKQAQDETERAQEEYDFWYDISRYDTNFMGDIITLVQQPKVSALKATKTRSF